MLTFSLQSGSNGNSIYVEAGGARLLFDAGISAKLAQERMAAHGRDIRDCDAIIISHNHSDHVGGLGPMCRKFNLPAWISPNVHQAVAAQVGPLSDVHYYKPGDRLTFGDVTVFTFRTPHDGIDTACFVVAHEGRKLAILTDLGSPFSTLRDILGSVDAAYLESNYDPDMLEEGPYPDDLKRRITGPSGHLSNQEAADLTFRCAGKKSSGGRLKWIAAAHLSAENNHPELALKTIRSQIGRAFPVRLASRYAVSEVMEV